MEVCLEGGDPSTTFGGPPFPKGEAFLKWVRVLF